MRYVVYLILALFLAGCAPMGTVTKLMPDLPENEIDMRNHLIGEWGITLDTKDGGKRRENAIMNADGTFKFTFTNISKSGDIEDEYSLTGLWGLVHNIHFTISLGTIEEGKHYNKDTSDPHNYSAYEVIELNDSIFKYRSLVTNVEFSLVKLKKGGLQL